MRCCGWTCSHWPSMPSSCERSDTDSLPRGRDHEAYAGHPASQRVIVWWRRLAVMTRKEMLQLSRDVPDRAAPCVLLYAGGVPHRKRHSITTAQCQPSWCWTADHSFSSRELIHRFQAPFFRLEGEIADPQEGLRLLDRGKAMAVLEIPPRFHEQLVTGEPTAVQLLVDTTNSPQGLSAASYAARIVATVRTGDRAGANDGRRRVVRESCRSS